MQAIKNDKRKCQQQAGYGQDLNLSFKSVIKSSA